MEDQKHSLSSLFNNAMIKAYGGTTAGVFGFAVLSRMISSEESLSLDQMLVGVVAAGMVGLGTYFGIKGTYDLIRWPQAFNKPYETEDTQNEY